VYNEALNRLRSLMRNLFHEPRLVVKNYDETLKVEKYHGPLIILNQIESSHWAWVPLFYREIHLDENGLTEFLDRTQLSTFILVTILTGEFTGNHLLSIE
jgi:hypothetical protein